MINQFGPLGASFQVVRIFQAMGLVAIVGMSANFVSMMVTATTNPSRMLVAVLVVVSYTLAHGRHQGEKLTEVLVHRCRPLLRRDIPLAPQQFRPTIPDQRRGGHAAHGRADCGVGPHRPTTIVPELLDHQQRVKQVQRVSICLESGVLFGEVWDLVRVLSDAVQGSLFGDESDLGTEHCIVVSVPTNSLKKLCAG